MKRLLCLALFVPAVALAASFATTAPIALTAKGALHRLELPFEVYRDARTDLGDVRVLDPSNEEVPFAFAAEAPPRREALPSVALPMFPVSKLEAPERGGEIAIRSTDGVLVTIQGARRSGSIARAAAYLLDASALTEPIAALVFEWDAGPGTEVVDVRIEASDDLRSWNLLGAGPLVHVDNGGRLLTQPRVEFAPRKAKYLRVTWNAPEFMLRSVRAEAPVRERTALRLTNRVEAKPGAEPGEWLYDLGAALPVEALRLIPSQSNDVIAATLSARNDEKTVWRSVARAPFYRLQMEGGERQAPPMEVGRIAARYWKANAAAPRTPPPVLEVLWRPREIVFVARGEGPFTLAFGDAMAPAAALPIASLIPDYQAYAEAKLPLAKAGAAKVGPPPSRWERMMDAPPKRVALWGVLIAGVALLGFMAWRLSRPQA